VISGFGTWGFRHSDGNAPVLVAESEGDGRVVWRFEGGREREEYASMEMPRCFRAVMSKRSIGFGFGLLGDEDKHLFCPTWISRTHTHTHKSTRHHMPKLLCCLSLPRLKNRDLLSLSTGKKG
jgi:hypothetical protein